MELFIAFYNLMHSWRLIVEFLNNIYHFYSVMKDRPYIFLDFNVIQEIIFQILAMLYETQLL